MIIYFLNSGSSLDRIYYEYKIINQNSQNITLNYRKNNTNSQLLIAPRKSYTLEDWYIIWDGQFKISWFTLSIQDKVIYNHKILNSKIPFGCPVQMYSNVFNTEEKWTYKIFFPFYSQWKYTKCKQSIDINTWIHRVKNKWL